MAKQGMCLLHEEVESKTSRGRTDHPTVRTPFTAIVASLPGVVFFRPLNRAVHLIEFYSQFQLLGQTISKLK